MKYKILEHTGDLKLWVWGADLVDLFKNAAEGMFFAMTGKIKKGNRRHKIIKISGEDEESLLVNFLNELLYLSDINNEGYKVCDLKFKNKNELEAKLVPYPLPLPEIEIKSATYYDLKIKKTPSGWEAVVVFDI